MIVGEEEDDFFGKTSGTGYSRLSFDPDVALPEPDALLDSIFFNLNVRTISGTDLDEPKYYSIHRLEEQILDTLYYNFDELSYDQTPLASGEVVFGEKVDTLLKLQVTPEFAQELFTNLKEGLYFKDIFQFRDYFPGIVIKAREGDNTSIGVGLGTNTGFTTYFHSEGDTVSKAYTISASAKLSGSQNVAAARSFSGIKSDRSGTPTSQITETKKAYDVGPLVGMKAGLGMTIRLDTSPFDAFLDTLSGITFNQVVLEMGAVEPQDSTQKVPSSIIAYFTNLSNDILTTSTGIKLSVQSDGFPQVYTDENGDEVPSTTAPAVFGYDPDARIYSQLITSHINALFRDKLTRKDWLLYVDSPTTAGDDFARSLRQFAVDKNKIKVKVIYSKSR